LRDQLQGPYGGETFNKAVTRSFQEVDRRLREDGIGQRQGSTVSLALVDLEKGALSTANLGDSYVFLLEMEQHTGKFEVFKLSQKHSPSEESERQRIEIAGGQVRHSDGVDRVGREKIHASM
jgi:serine/threonine protein phosphatase PrpC